MHSARSGKRQRPFVITRTQRLRLRLKFHKPRQRSAIGIARHFGKQVPWEGDADVAALLGTGGVTWNNRKNFIYNKLLPRLPGTWTMRPVEESRYCLQYHLTKCFGPGCDSKKTMDLGS